MKLHLRSFLIGVVFGAIATWTFVLKPSSPKTLLVTPKGDSRKLDWATIDLAKQIQSGESSLQARVWCENGACYLLEPKTSLETWSNGQSPTASSPPAFRVTDASFYTREWLLKSSNGGVCIISGHMTQVADGPSWLLGEFDRVDDATLNSGLEAKWPDLERTAARYHEKVIRIAGRIGKHPQLAHLYLYPDEDTWKARSHDKALMLERTFVLHDDSNFSLLDTDGADVVLEGVYRRPFRDDGEAPVGTLTILHRAIVGNLETTPKPNKTPDDSKP